MNGTGWGSLPEHLIREELAQGLLDPINVEGQVYPPDIELRVARLDGEPVGPVAQRLWELFQGDK